MTIIQRVNSSTVVGRMTDSFERGTMLVDPDTLELRVYDGTTLGGQPVNPASNISNSSTSLSATTDGNILSTGNIVASGGASPAPYITGFSTINTYDGASLNGFVFENGNLTLAGGGIIYGNPFTPSGAPGNTITLQPAGSGTITDQRLLIYPTAGDGDHLHLATGNLYQTELFLGSDYFYAKLSNTGNFVIQTNDNISNTAQWTFGSDGNLTLPGNTFAVNYANGTQVSLGGGGGGTVLPANSSGYLRNDGSGNLSWATGSPLGSGTLSYSDVWVISAKDSSFWTTYTLNGTYAPLFNWNGIANVSLSSQTVYGRQLSTSDKILAINDATINSDSYGIVFEFPSSPTVGETFSASTAGDVITVNAGSFIVGRTYTIVTTGTTNWTAIGAQFAGAGQTFVATGAGSGTGTASTAEGVGNRFYVPAAGQRAKTIATGGNQSVPFYFGPNETVKGTFIPTGSQLDAQPIVWVYVGVLDGTPTWYQMYF